MNCCNSYFPCAVSPLQFPHEEAIVRLHMHWTPCAYKYIVLSFLWSPTLPIPQYLQLFLSLLNVSEGLLLQSAYTNKGRKELYFSCNWNAKHVTFLKHILSLSPPNTLLKFWFTPAKTNRKKTYTWYLPS